MARLVFGMNQSLDGYVDHTRFAPDPVLFRHFVAEAAQQTGSLYGRKIYDIMRYWDEDQVDWEPDSRAFAKAWRAQPKWVVSRAEPQLGPNATLLKGDLGGAVRRLKEDHPGEIEVAGPDLAGTLTALGLIDEYRIYLHPVVLGHGAPYFTGARPPLRLVSESRIGDVVRLSYVPA
jgi:dihydrofolate reductase